MLRDRGRGAGCRADASCAAVPEWCQARSSPAATRRYRAGTSLGGFPRDGDGVVDVAREVHSTGAGAEEGPHARLRHDAREWLTPFNETPLAAAASGAPPACPAP